jgi:hypothetical protein
MSKTTASFSRKNKATQPPSAELIPMIRSAYHRLTTMLEICDYHVAELSKKSKVGDEKASRELRGLFNTMLRLQKEVAKYGALLYPSQSEISPSNDNSSENINSSPSLYTEKAIPNTPTNFANSLIEEGFGYLKEEFTDSLSVPKKQKFSEHFFKRPPKAKSPAC